MSRVKKLSEFIAEHQEAIADEWIEYAWNFIDPAFGMKRNEVKDHVLEMLEEISKDMETLQSKKEQKAKSRGQKEINMRGDHSASSHGIQRLESGFDIVHLSSEFRALRASVLRLWEEKMQESQGNISYHDIVRFNEAIDEAWMQSIKHYQERLDRSRHWFIGVLGHDLRSPLNSLISIQGILAESKNLNEEEKELLAGAKSGLKRMDGLITNLLELAKLHLGSSFNISRDTIDLDQVCKELVDEFRSSFSEAKIIYRSPGTLRGEWDRVRVGQVVSNLLSNAIKYGEKKAPIILELSAMNSHVELSVHNEGRPIPSKIKDKIFEGLFTYSEGQNQDRLGNGLGLHIVEKIVKAHHGKIEVESNEEQGTTFTVELPRH